MIQHEGASINKQRHEKPPAYSINLDANNRFAVAADLGTEELVVYQFDTENEPLSANSSTKLRSGAGPRPFAFHPNEKYTYYINELQSTVTMLKYDNAVGQISQLQTTSTLPRDFAGKV